jgi:hypothetical protein
VRLRADVSGSLEHGLYGARDFAGQHGLHCACGILPAGRRHKTLLGKSGCNLPKAAAIIESAGGCHELGRTLAERLAPLAPALSGCARLLRPIAYSGGVSSRPAYRRNIPVPSISNPRSKETEHPRACGKHVLSAAYSGTGFWWRLRALSSAVSRIPRGSRMRLPA